MDHGAVVGKQRAKVIVNPHRTNNNYYKSRYLSNFFGPKCGGDDSAFLKCVFNVFHLHFTECILVPLFY